MESKELNLNLNVEEVNIILESLSRAQYALVYKVIGKVQQQAQEQINNIQDESIE